MSLKMSLTDLWICFAFILSLAQGIAGGETCTYYNTYGYYTSGYCDGYCCSKTDDYCCSSWGWIAGVVVGAIVFVAVVAVVVFMVCAKMKAKKSRTVHVATVNTRSTGYSYNNNYNQFNKPPGTVMSNMPAPPPYSQVAFQQPGAGAYPPPPAYRETVTPYPPPPNGGTQSTSFSTGNNAAYPPPPPVY
ncbi:hypothetical protein MAR_025205 [Mya arenaria]|uniref:Uncharacterized protein n=1 Tax=Mya arenaria TaxID=6604 RepID=A0ABY7DVX7_MYAAR|nr:cysteine and tyrosine-rich protein 1-like [Mya arenaria]WAR00833.1 hypothetical protein MAR_025205 [Mya arenaria]